MCQDSSHRQRERNLLTILDLPEDRTPVMTTDSRSTPDCEITYTALRSAFVLTLDSLLRYSLDPESLFGTRIGFMSCFPMLNGTAPQIQLEFLFRTWSRIQNESTSSLDLLDDLVLYAAYESLAQVTTDKKNHSLNVALRGPKRLSSESDVWLHSKVRCFQISWAGPVKTQFLRELKEIGDPGPWFESEIEQNCGENREELMEVVGRWHAQKNVLLGSEGLLTQDEQDILRAFFEEHPGLVR